jgi:hypothetical protein
MLSFEFEHFYFEHFFMNILKSEQFFKVENK